MEAVAPSGSPAEPPQLRRQHQGLGELEGGAEQAEGLAAVALGTSQTPEHGRRPRVLLAATGSVASIKLVQLAELLLQVRYEAPC